MLILMYEFIYLCKLICHYVYPFFCTCCFSALSPVLGVGVINSKILGSAILCLTSKMECIVQPLK